MFLNPKALEATHPTIGESWVGSGGSRRRVVRSSFDLFLVSTERMRSVIVCTKPSLLCWWDGPPESRVHQTQESGHPQQLFSVRGWNFGWPLSHWGSTMWAEMIGVPGKHWQPRQRVTEHQETVERTCEPSSPRAADYIVPFHSQPTSHTTLAFPWYPLVLIVCTFLFVEGRGPSKSGFL